MLPWYCAGSNLGNQRPLWLTVGGCSPPLQGEHGGGGPHTAPVRRQRQAPAQALFSLFSPAQPVGCLRPHSGASFHLNLSENILTEMPRSVSDVTPNPVRLAENLSITSLPWVGKDPVGGCGIGGTRRLQEPAPAVQSHSPSSRGTRPRPGHAWLPSARLPSMSGASQRAGSCRAGQSTLEVKQLLSLGREERAH